MNTTLPDPRSAQNERAWVKALSAYRKPNRLRSVFELSVTVIPFVALWVLALAAVACS